MLKEEEIVLRLKDTRVLPETSQLLVTLLMLDLKLYLFSTRSLIVKLQCVFSRGNEAICLETLCLTDERKVGITRDTWSYRSYFL